MRQQCRQTKSILRWPVWFLTAYLMAANPVAIHSANASREEIYHYREVTGNTIKEVKWHLFKADRYTLVYTASNEKHVTITDENYNTLSWHVIAQDGQTDLTATRVGDVIKIEGRFKGAPVDKHLEIDERPWYQATSLSLRGLIASQDDKRLFWTIRFKTLTIHKIKAIKKEMETLDSSDPLLHIRMTLPGLLAPFWKSDYWFGLPEGVLFRFQGPSGPPGSPTVTITRMAG